MISHYLDDLIENSDRILLLQGPIGSFFTDLSEWLRTQNKTVFKINLNAGDEYFYPNSVLNTFAYRDSLENFHHYLVSFCQTHHIDQVICFGDNRKYHKIAKKVCQSLSVGFWAFEEGYFRPNYVTFEKSGVNAYSPIPCDATYFSQFENLPEPAKPQHVAKGFCPMAKLAIQYYVSAYYRRHHYPKYRHHRLLNVLYYVKLWSISGVKRLHYYLYDWNFAKRVEKGEFGDFFILPLQVYDDSQILVHSDYSSVEAILREVLLSFATKAPKHLRLIVKHHPMDRGFIDYGKVIDEYLEQYPELKKRIYYIHDVPMPVFLRHGKGMVTLNSTSGISALLHNMPVKTLGRANYDFAGLTYQGSLDDFWSNSEKPDDGLFNAYRKFHLHKTHINGSFYNKVILRYPYNQS
ncbi:capsule polysaccharide transporter [Actinobacillus pleuropneumoniae]|uniref:capsule biosynthesis protein n=1 Tax=Actinobacillus pleuropneumoniae TaxID=715 RepID=UPI000045D87D|nr:capsule biosynthesis protein [Actinobacillus pleuropneumoniae]MEE3683501.1 capsule biosynthesis protein [Actinobacillus pleuropneumoniae]QSZ39759.1 capsule polysaccharide transporter [Actinobacillus pleuropneumoniae]UKH10031.1 capsule biosynthesis protein [Actinobacillus pleuropneumoniae]UKH20815.1 capsule biosynthesis protein [Actinobacillus pleuropneumoniae]UPA20558.1 capsule biosynthesis protein [Actinobacillus pleuropneumoniae]